MKAIILSLWVVALVVMLSACKDPIKPEPVPEDPRFDTVRAFVRATVRSPSMNTVWEVRTPDTLWNGVTTTI